jgi:mono/diheme cytochrome c family protein
VALILPAWSPSEPEAPESDTRLELFATYCASCHGALGLGDGPVARSLSPRPADLTTLARRNGGKFDPQAVMATIDGRNAVAAHGPREMPVWGVVFAQEHAGAGQRQAGQLSLLLTTMLTEYVASIQKE